MCCTWGAGVNNKAAERILCSKTDDSRRQAPRELLASLLCLYHAKASLRADRFMVEFWNPSDRGPFITIATHRAEVEIRAGSELRLLRWCKFRDRLLRY